jgi:hypothetical protein
MSAQAPGGKKREKKKGGRVCYYSGEPLCYFSKPPSEIINDFIILKKRPFLPPFF